MTNIKDLTDSLDEQNNAQQQKDEKQVQLNAISESGDKVVKAVEASTQPTRTVKGEVKVTNTDLAKSQDVNQAIEAINKLNLTTFMQNEGLPKLAQNISDLSDKTGALQEKMENEGLKKMSDQLAQVVATLNALSKTLSKTEISVDVKLQKTIDNLSKRIDAIDFKPSVTVTTPDTKVVTTPVDLKPVVSALSDVKQAIIDSEKEETEQDISPITGGLAAVQNAIQALRFPVSNYVLPFTTKTGKATQVVLNDDGTLPITAGGGGGGTQYADGASAVTHPIGTQQVYTNGSGTVTAVSTTNPLPITGSLSVGGTTDEAAFTAGTSTFSSSGGVFNDSVAALTSGQQGAQRLTNNRALHTNIRNAAGTELATSSNPLQVSLANTGANTNKLLVTPDSIALPANQSVNESQINGVIPLMGNGVTGTGSQRVTIASDNTAFSVNATLSAETTKVIGTVNQGTSPWVVSGTVAATQSGTWTNTVTQATAANLNATVVGTGTFAVQSTLQAGTSLIGKVGIDQTTPGTTNKVSIGTDGIVTITATDTAPATQNITVIDSGSTSTISNNQQVLVTGSPTAGSVASFSISSQESVRVEVTGTWTGTVTSEISIDGGTTWFAQGLHQGAYVTSTFQGNFAGGGSVTGATNYRLRATATMTGTATVKVVSSLNTNSVYIANAAPSGNIISALNSSVATLTSGSTFTGAGEDVSNFSEMRVTVTASHVSATDGLSIQQSTDNTNWDVTDTYTIPATTGKTFVVPRQARYFRVVYTNGGTNQSSFRLQSILNRIGSASSSQRTSDGYSNENDLEQNWVFNSIFNNTTWDRIRSASGASNTTGTGLLGAAPLPLAATALPTAATATNYVPEMADKYGRPVVLPNAMRDIMGSQTTTITSSTSETTIITAAASTFNDLVSVFISNTSATAARVDIRDTTGGSIIFQLFIPAGDMRGLSLTTPWPQSGANTNWTAQSSASVADLRVSALFVKNK